MISDTQRLPVGRSPSFLNPQANGRDDIIRVKLLAKITVVATAALIISTAATFQSDSVGSSLLLGESMLSLLITRDFYKITTNAESADSRHDLELNNEDIRSRLFLSARIDQVTEGTILRPIWRFLFNRCG